MGPDSFADGFIAPLMILQDGSLNGQGNFLDLNRRCLDNRPANCNQNGLLHQDSSMANKEAAYL